MEKRIMQKPNLKLKLIIIIVLTILSLIINVIAVLNLKNTSAHLKQLEKQSNQLNLDYKLDQQQASLPKHCADYTLNQFREGEAPAKCQAEVYGDQFID